MLTLIGGGLIHRAVNTILAVPVILVVVNWDFTVTIGARLRFGSVQDEVPFG